MRDIRPDLIERLEYLKLRREQIIERSARALEEIDRQEQIVRALLDAEGIRLGAAAEISPILWTEKPLV